MMAAARQKEMKVSMTVVATTIRIGAPCWRAGVPGLGVPELIV